ncbi:MAG: fibronectin type III domain-containing protein, partial [Chloroflexi bacterium]|nr:fibronectin type III domain-containing protein [Chloroflexota bacterium]
MRCSTVATLSDDDFSHEGSDHTIISIASLAGVYFYIQLDKAFPQSLSAATLNVGSKSYPLSGASPGNIGNLFMFQGTSGQIPQLTVGSTVALSLVLPPPPIPVSLSASPNLVTEGRSVRVTARLAEALAQTLTVPVRQSRGTAELGDYGVLSSITIPAGATSGTGTVTTVRDADPDDEVFTVALGSLPPGLAAGSPSSVRIRITDLDASPVTHLAAAPGHQQLTVTWRNPSHVRSNAVRWRAQGTTAWLNPNGAAGSISASPVRSFTITTLTNGTTYEVQVRAVEVISGVRSASRWVSTTGTPTPTVSLSYAQWRVAEGSPATVTARLSAPPAAGFRLVLEVAGFRRTSEADDHDEGPFNIDFGAGETVRNLQVATNHDADADDETFRVGIAMTDAELAAAGFRRGILTFADFTILDDEGRPKVTLSASPARVAEGESVTVTATLSEALTEDLTLPIRQSRGTTEVDDYEDLFRITIPGGRTTGTGTFRAKHDVDPDDETFTVALAHVPPALASAGSPSSVEVTIVDDDTTEVTLEAEHASVPEGATNYITLRFSEPVPLNRGVLNGDPHVTAWVRVTDTGTGTLLARVPVVVKGHMTKTGFFAGNDVDEDGDDESVTVTLETDNLPAWMTVGEPTSVTYTVDDAQEASVSLSVSPARVTEGSPVTVTATLSNPLTDRRSELQVPLELTAGSAGGRGLPLGAPGHRDPGRRDDGHERGGDEAGRRHRRRDVHGVAAGAAGAGGAGRAVVGPGDD